MSLVVFVTGSNRQILVNLLPLLKAAPPNSTADTNAMIAAMLDVFMYFCARNGLTTTKHLSHEMTVDRNCDTHVDPPRPGNKMRLIIHGIKRLFMAPHLIREGLGPLEVPEALDRGRGWGYFNITESSTN